MKMSIMSLGEIMDLRILKTKKGLYDALLHLMGEKPFEAIKVSEICEKAMINRSTFYAHFEDKYSLFNALILDLKNELDFALSKNQKILNTKEYYMEVIHLLLDHIESNRDIYMPLMLHNKNSIAMDMIYSTLIENVTAKISKEQKNENSKIPFDFVTHFYVGALFQIGMKWLQSKKYYSKDEILNYLNLLIPENLI